MNILFLSIGGLNNLDEQAVYPDLLRYFRIQGHNVNVICQREKRSGLETEKRIESGINIVRVKTGNITKTNLIEKGISTLLIGIQFKNAIKKYFQDIKFDLILYTTPPITIYNTVSYVKKRDNAVTYLLLKDIFPQNALDIGIMKNKGFSCIIYLYFKNIERKLYAISDHIGCMSEANLDYILENNRKLDKSKVEVCPNTIDPITVNYSNLNSKFVFPSNKVVMVYGGNFGKPQNVDFIVDVLKDNEKNEKIHFILVGSGTDFYKIKELKNVISNNYLTVYDNLNKHDYHELLKVCDIGLVFLDFRFTIPNFPSRVLDYMNNEIPVFAVTDKNTDLGKLIIEEKFGWWCESNSMIDFKNTLDLILKDKDKFHELGIHGKKYLIDNYSTSRAYEIITNHFKIKEKEKNYVQE